MALLVTRLHMGESTDPGVAGPMSAFEHGELQAAAQPPPLHGLVRDGAQIVRGTRSRRRSAVCRGRRRGCWTKPEAGRQIQRFKGLAK